jgi:sulfur-carrier protein
VRVELPPHLRRLAGVGVEVVVEVDEGEEGVSLTGVLDALEARFPVLAGTIRDPGSERRRPLMRFFACGRDLSHDPPHTPLPAEVARGREVLRVVGAIAGG